MTGHHYTDTTRAEQTEASEPPTALRWVVVPEWLERVLAGADSALEAADRELAKQRERKP